MAEGATVAINSKKAAHQLLPPCANFDACLICGLCSSGCPASGLENMDPRKSIRMVMLGMDAELSTTRWVWYCTLCKRCAYVCPMKIDISHLVYLALGNWPQDKMPEGITRSGKLAQRGASTSAMDKRGAHFFVNQNLRELMSEPDEMVPLLKTLDLVAALRAHPLADL